MSWHGRRLREQAGFAITEVLASVVVVAIGIVGTLGVFDASGHSTLSSQRSEQAISIGQREIEKVKAIPYDELGLSAIPVHEDTGLPPGDPQPNSPADPDYYVTNGSLAVKANYYDDNSTTIANEALLGSGDVSPGPDQVTSGQATATVYRFVTQRTQSCDATIADRCSGGALVSKRITVAVVMNVPGGATQRPVWLSTIVTDPNAGPGNQTSSPPTASPGDGPVITSQPFFLHDTPCSAAARQDITASHPTHDTGRTGATCSGSTPPDLMDTTPAPDGTGVPLYDYSDDLARSDPAGLALRRTSDATCPTSYADADAGTQMWSIHTWSTPPFAADFTAPSSGARDAFSFWTRSVDGVAGSATLCLTLSRASDPANPLVQTTYRTDNWPTTWDQLAFAFDSPGYTIAAGDRLELTLSVQGGSDHDVELLFDHPSYRSFLSVGTTTPIQ